MNTSIISHQTINYINKKNLFLYYLLTLYGSFALVNNNMNINLLSKYPFLYNYLMYNSIIYLFFGFSLMVRCILRIEKKVNYYIFKTLPFLFIVNLLMNIYYIFFFFPVEVRINEFNQINNIFIPIQQYINIISLIINGKLLLNRDKYFNYKNFNDFEKILINSKIKIKNIDIDETCSICLIEITNNIKKYIVITNCNHLYHIECLKKWFNINKTCPLCKGNLLENTSA